MQPILTATIDTPLGPMLAGAAPGGVCLLEFSDRDSLPSQLAHICKKLSASRKAGESPHLAQLHSELAEYFAGRRRTFEVPLLYPGTDFQMQVWNALLQIPFGQTRTYEEIARQTGHPHSARAVGTANGRNPISILIPCHRLVNKGGGLGGFGGGLWRKHKLLEMEGAI